MTVAMQLYSLCDTGACLSTTLFAIKIIKTHNFLTERWHALTEINIASYDSITMQLLMDGKLLDTSLKNA